MWTILGDIYELLGYGLPVTAINIVQPNGTLMLDFGYASDFLQVGT